MKKLTCYLSSCICGKKGNNATKEDIDLNCAIGQKILIVLERAFPDVDFFAPACHDKIVQRLWLKKYITREQIMECDKEEQLSRDCTIAFMWENSEGVKEEIANSEEHNQPIYISALTYPDVVSIREHINRWKENKC